MAGLEQGVGWRPMTKAKHDSGRKARHARQVWVGTREACAMPWCHKARNVGHRHVRGKAHDTTCACTQDGQHAINVQTVMWGTQMLGAELPM